MKTRYYIILISFIFQSLSVIAQENKVDFIIESDRQVYEFGEEIVIRSTIKNNSRKTLILKSPYGGQFYFENEWAEQYRFSPRWKVPALYFTFTCTQIDHLQLEKRDGYEVIGKHCIYVRFENLISNMIEIEIVTELPISKFDPELKTPISTLRCLKKAVSEYNWNRAEECFSTAIRNKYLESIKDRRFFDYLLQPGYKGRRHIKLLMNMLEDSDLDLFHGELNSRFFLVGEKFVFSYAIGEGGPSVGEATIELVRESNGWKISRVSTRDEEDFDDRYEKEIKKEYKGKAKALEYFPTENL